MQVTQGNEDAFGSLVDRFQDMAVGYAYSMLGDYDYALDAVQKVFIQVSNLSRLREIQVIYPKWLTS